MTNAVMCSGLCNSDADDYCGMYLEGEECPACAEIKNLLTFQTIANMKGVDAIALT